MTVQMQIQQLDVVCHPCNHWFTAEIVVNAPVDVAVASMMAVRCPQCGKGPDGIAIGARPRQATAGRLDGDRPDAGSDPGAGGKAG